MVLVRQADRDQIRLCRVEHVGDMGEARHAERTSLRISSARITTDDRHQLGVGPVAEDAGVLTTPTTWADDRDLQPALSVSRQRHSVSILSGFSTRDSAARVYGSRSCPVDDRDQYPALDGVAAAGEAVGV